MLLWFVGFVVKVRWCKEMIQNGQHWLQNGFNIFIYPHEQWIFRGIQSFCLVRHNFVVWFSIKNSVMNSKRSHGMVETFFAHQCPIHNIFQSIEFCFIFVLQVIGIVNWSYSVGKKSISKFTQFNIRSSNLKLIAQLHPSTYS